MRRYMAWVVALLLGTAALSCPAAEDNPSVLLLLGAPGAEEYGSNFIRQAAQWAEAARKGGATVTRIPSEAAQQGGYNLLKQRLAAEPKEGTAPLWLLMIGHGTFDGREARFNLTGPDLSAAELAGWLKPIRRPVVILNTASASAPFLNALSASNRVILTATRSGNEQNFTRFGQFISQAIGDVHSDLDQDGQVSLLEAFLAASASVADFYKTEGRLATEHALIDDNGDGLGTPANWFRGVRAVKKPEKGAVDGLRAHQIHLVPNASEQALPAEVRARRDALELDLARLREVKATLPEDQYYAKLEAILMQLARLQVGRGSDGSIHK